LRFLVAYLNCTVPNPGPRAAPYFGKACTDKVTIGCLGLGTIYRDGRGTPKNRERAVELYQKACDGGVKAACSQAKAAKP
jgi:TPR repeat protein